jgi:hypothetical protein
MDDGPVDDFTFEEEVSRNPYSIRNWWGYINSKRDAPPQVRVADPVAAAAPRRASAAPRLHASVAAAACVTLGCCAAAVFQTRVLIYERALQSLPGCYKIWRDYLVFRRQKVRGVTDAQRLGARPHRCCVSRALLRSCSCSRVVCGCGAWIPTRCGAGDGRAGARSLHHAPVVGDSQQGVRARAGVHAQDARHLAGLPASADGPEVRDAHAPRL